MYHSDLNHLGHTILKGEPRRWQSVSNWLFLQDTQGQVVTAGYQREKSHSRCWKSVGGQGETGRIDQSRPIPPQSFRWHWTSVAFYLVNSVTLGKRNICVSRPQNNNWEFKYLASTPYCTIHTVSFSRGRKVEIKIC